MRGERSRLRLSRFMESENLTPEGCFGAAAEAGGFAATQNQFGAPVLAAQPVVHGGLAVMAVVGARNLFSRQPFGFRSLLRRSRLIYAVL